MTSRSSGLWGASHGANAATRAQTPTMIVPTISAVFRRTRPRADSSGSARTLGRAIGWAVDMSGSAHPDARIEHAVEEIDDQVHHDVNHGRQHRHAEDARVVKAGGCRD